MFAPDHPSHWQESGVPENCASSHCTRMRSTHRSSGLSAILLPLFRTAHLVTMGLRWTSEVYIAYPDRLLVQELAEVWADMRGQGSRVARKEHSAPPERLCSLTIRKCAHMLKVNYPLLLGIDCHGLKFVGYWNSWGKKPGGN